MARVTLRRNYKADVIVTAAVNIAISRPMAMFTALRRKHSYIPLKRYIYGIRRKHSQISLYGYVYGIQSKMKRKIRFRGIHSNEYNIYKKQRGLTYCFLVNLLLKETRNLSWKIKNWYLFGYKNTVIEFFRLNLEEYNVGMWNTYNNKVDITSALFIDFT